ncbi:Similar to MADS box protein gb/L46400 from Zea mays [Arabidopsis thaliana]|uniref:Agamous-like MADS-box protein AGL49 n=1 Tax=Arabidopsis thaliana TaxID=3702 RepID=AGL49_ARATH|nr:AGAMOUS-like 49 [Arabidopsis thaliana]Q9ZUI9.1 RecName: Full=Agamous-like MADS-box protein AGL49 [Arabidopsis thaliana]AAD14480.1 Similar to MADS box protein gb/L46400 from Zea mays [Arabidopsis thaliana]AEE33652.1 AGAMOUS-like 49 [Arabidopsis thaliana]|eukprot:NP_176212.1 AGAMOUS-like 49 [Arabidopsis thaliana]
MAPRQKKPNKSDDDDGDLHRKKQSFFKQRFPGFKKKASELSVLCGNSVGFICYGPDNDLHVWPQSQDHNPQALHEIVAKFNALSDERRKNHACDLNDFPHHLKGLSREELRKHLLHLDSQLLGVREQKIEILKKTLTGSSEKDGARVSENSAISDHKLKIEPNLTDILSEDHLIRVSDKKLGSCDVFDELAYVVRGSRNLNENVSNYESKDAAYTGMDHLGTFGGNYLQEAAAELYQTYNLGNFCDDHVWDLEFASRLPPLHTFSDPLMTTNTCQTMSSDMISI